MFWLGECYEAYVLFIELFFKVTKSGKESLHENNWREGGQDVGRGALEADGGVAGVHAATDAVLGEHGVELGQDLLARQVMAVQCKAGDAGVRELVGVDGEAAGAYGIGLRQLGHRRHLYDKAATAFQQGPGVRGLVHHHGQSGRCKIQRTGPGGSHDVVHALVAGRYQHGRTVIDQPVGLVERYGSEMGWHGWSPRK